jgi:hypothetical protein
MFYYLSMLANFSFANNFAMSCPINIVSIFFCARQ